MFEPGRKLWLFYPFLFDPVPDFTNDQHASKKLSTLRGRVPGANRRISPVSFAEFREDVAMEQKRR
jgi:hypothetical protein